MFTAIYINTGIRCAKCRSPCSGLDDFHGLIYFPEVSLSLMTARERQICAFIGRSWEPSEGSRWGGGPEWLELRLSSVVCQVAGWLLPPPPSLPFSSLHDFRLTRSRSKVPLLISFILSKTKTPVAQWSAVLEMQIQGACLQSLHIGDHLLLPRLVERGMC